MTWFTWIQFGVVALSVVALVVVIRCSVQVERYGREAVENWRQAEAAWRRAETHWKQAAENWKRVADAQKKIAEIRRNRR